MSTGSRARFGEGESCRVSDGGLIVMCEFDERLGFGELIEQNFARSANGPSRGQWKLLTLQT